MVHINSSYQGAWSLAPWKPLPFTLMSMTKVDGEGVLSTVFPWKDTGSPDLPPEVVLPVADNPAQEQIITELLAKLPRSWGTGVGMGAVAVWLVCCHLGRLKYQARSFFTKRQGRLYSLVLDGKKFCFLYLFSFYSAVSLSLCGVDRVVSWGAKMFP